MLSIVPGDALESPPLNPPLRRAMNAPPDYDAACPFCRNLAGNPRCAFVSQSDTVSAFVNPRQYRPGALLVIPNRHALTVFDMTPAEWSAVAIEAQRLAVAACTAYGAPGVNIFHNTGPSVPSRNYGDR